VHNPKSSSDVFCAPIDARIYVIDDHSEIRRSLSVLLATVGITTWPFAHAADFLADLHALPPAPILLDVRMPGLDGTDVMRALADRGCTWPVIAMTAHGDVAVAVTLMKLGAIEFLEKPFDLDLALVAFARAYDLLASASRTETEAHGARQKFARLSRREAEVIRDLLKGVPNKIVAADLGLSIRTVEMYRATALAKLTTRTIVETLALAQSAGWSGARFEAH
jgi:two-component system, LuxR family, response regulator FixJ